MVLTYSQCQIRLHESPIFGTVPFMRDTTEFTCRVAGAMRAEVARLGIDGVALTEPLGLSRNSVYARLRGAKPFSTDEIERAADFLGVPIERLVLPASSTKPASLAKPGAAA